MDEVRAQIASHASQWTWPAGCVPYLPADWHVTLHFIGKVDTTQVEGVAAGSDVPFQPCGLTLDQPQRWPHGLAVLCTEGVAQPQEALYDRLAAAFAAALQCTGGVDV